MTVASATGRPASMSSAISPSSGNVSRFTFSTYTSRIPPQVSPTANASSSETPYLSSTGTPESTTDSARSYTAPSTQPPDTEPTASPVGPTSIEAPAGRGADWKVATTVPTPTVSPASHHRISSSMTSRTADHLQHVGERPQRVAGDELVAVRQRGGDAALHGLVARLAAVGVDPHHAVRQPLHPLHLLSQLGGVAAFPTVAEDNDDRAAGHSPGAPPVQEGLQGLPQPGAAGPVRHLLAGADERAVGIAGAQGEGDAGQSGAEREGLDATAVARGRDHQVGEPQQRVRVGAHRGGHVDQQHDPPRRRTPPAVLDPSRLTHLPQRRTQSAVDVDLSPPPGRTPVCPASRQPGPQPTDQQVEQGLLVRAEPTHVTVLQHLALAGRCLDDLPGHLPRRLPRVTDRQRRADPARLLAGDRARQLLARTE